MFPLINLIGNVFELYIVTLFFTKTSTPRIKRPYLTAVSCLLTIVQFLSNQFFLTKSYLVMIGMLLYLFLVSLLYTMKFPLKIFSVGFLYALFALSEIAVAMISTTIMKVDLLQTQTDMILFALCTLISKFITLSIVLLFKKQERSKHILLPISFTLKIFPLPISTILVMMLLFNCCYTFTSFGFRLLTLLSTVFLIVSNILVFHIIEKQRDYIHTKESLSFAQSQVKNQISHYTELYSYQAELKTFKHDCKNRLIALSGLLKSNDISRAISLIEDDINFLNDKGKKILNSENPIVDAIIQSKINHALTLGVKIKPMFKLTEQIKINEFELGVLIGNALDNAIEATLKISEENRKPIKATLISFDEHLSFSVENFASETIDTKKLKTTKADKLNHGYGLKSIRTIALKYDGEVFTDFSENIFTLTITLINKEK